MNSAMLASDITNRLEALAQDGRGNCFNVLLNLIEAERQRSPVTPRQTLTKDQTFELRCLKDWLVKQQQHETTHRPRVDGKPGPASDNERNYDHWIETLETILK